MWFQFATLAMLAATSGQALDFGTIRAKAQALAVQPFVSSTNRLPAALAHLNYDQQRAIRFRSQFALWHNAGLPFQIEFIHPGWVYTDLVTMHEVEDNHVRAIPFTPAMFDYGNIPPAPPGLGFAGFRVVQPVFRQRTEVAVFAGASYFEMIGAGQVYGTSARGLALDTGLPRPEEFPVFKEFWLQKPNRGDQTLTIFALLDSPSVAGAFQFVIRPGATTVATVTAVFFVRQPVERFGLAPLTSMFWYGENSQRSFGDFRPEVHDADGLLVHNGRGEWLWRPLEAVAGVRVNAFLDENPRGFGLLQRDRDFSHYQDLEAKYQLRPSVWVVPLRPWGAGSVQLVQLPTDNEFNDNIVAFWVPAVTPKAGETIGLDYELQWRATEPEPPELDRVTATRVAILQTQPPRWRFVLDFDSHSRREPTAEVSGGDGAKLVEHVLQRNEFTGGWRLSFVVERAANASASELRAVLKAGSTPVSETWTYTWMP